ncbi:MAG: SRPBCC family protein, partial [Acidimicrobiia bacterium]|nr:SRPBCC family protein [Acidimicrobiia bacterium]
FVDDPKTWPTWYSGMTEILDSEDYAWDKVGDSVKVAYSVLGRQLDLTCTIEEHDEFKLVRFLCEVPDPLPDAMWTWRWTELGEDRLALTVTMEAEATTNWFGKIIDKMVLPRIYQRDLVASLDNLAEIAMVELT